MDDVRVGVEALALEASATCVRVRVEVKTLRLLPRQRMWVTGSCAALGGWERDLAARATFDEATRAWRLDFDVAPEELPVHYKYELRGGVGHDGTSHDVLESGLDRIAAPLGWTGTGTVQGAGSGGATSQSSEDEEREARERTAVETFNTSESHDGGARRENDWSGTPAMLKMDRGDGPAFNADGSPVHPSARPSHNQSEMSPSRELATTPEAAAASKASPYDDTPRTETPARVLGPRRAKTPSRIIVRDGHFRHPRAWRGSGVAVPVFSLRSRESVGAGDFGDLEALVDVAAEAGMSVVQLLPVNDTTVHNTWWDSYPYSSVSVHALHPLYLKLKPLVEEAANAAAAGPDAGRLMALSAEVDRAKHALDLKEIDYEATMRVKLMVAKRCFEATRATFLASEACERFVREQASWLKPYAVFSALRELFGTAEHWRWGDLSATNAAAVVARLSQPNSELYHVVSMHYYVQYHLDRQLRRAAAHAAARGVVLKGDLPIGVDKASVDTWMHPKLFRMNTSTGAPPDDFDPNGQNWGFPTYDWEEMSKDNYAWWRGRMTHLERFFSAMRIDHVLGFFRIWELPAHTKTGRLGRFRPSVPIRKRELDERGLWFVDRLCEPWVTSERLRALFGDRDGEAAGRFFEETGAETKPDGTTSTTYKFRKEYNTERGLLSSEALRVRDGSPDWLVKETEELRRGLMTLLQNVILLRDPDDADAFYPRIEFEKTTSFRDLDDWARDALSWLYDDYFNARQDATWRENARRTLPALMSCTGQLVCGEDLGMVPPCVPPVLEELGILGLRIQRMPHDGGEFGRPERYPYETVCSPSCHDTSTTRAWYEADPARRDRYAKLVLGMIGDGKFDSSFPPPAAYRVEHIEAGSGATRAWGGGHRGRVGEAGNHFESDDDARDRDFDLGGRRLSDDEVSLDDGGNGRNGRYVAPQVSAPEKCEPHVMRAIVRQHMASPSSIAIFPAQDLLALVGEYATRPAEEETINDPTNPKHYWRFRLHVRLEDMLANKAWLGEIRQLVVEGGRMPMTG